MHYNYIFWFNFTLIFILDRYRQAGDESDDSDCTDSEDDKPSIKGD